MNESARTSLTPDERFFNVVASYQRAHTFNAVTHAACLFWAVVYLAVYRTHGFYNIIVVLMGLSSVWTWMWGTYSHLRQVHWLRHGPNATQDELDRMLDFWNHDDRVDETGDGNEVVLFTTMWFTSATSLGLSAGGLLYTLTRSAAGASFDLHWVALLCACTDLLVSGWYFGKQAQQKSRVVMEKYHRHQWHT